MGHSPLLEEEVFMGTILQLSSHRRGRDNMADRLREASGHLVDRIRGFFQGYRENGENEENEKARLHMWLVRSMYGLQYALAEDFSKNKDWLEAQCSFGMIALRSAYECLDVLDKRMPDPRKLRRE